MKLQNSVDRIFITGDILRPSNNKLGDQNNNINWFYYLIKPFITNIALDLPVYKLLSTPNNKYFNVEEFYRFTNLDISIESWAELFDTKLIDEKAEAFFKQCFNNSLVISYELPPLFKSLMTKLEIPYIDFNLHPCRYLDDIFFGVTSNIDSINQKLEAFSIDQNLFYTYANFCKARLSQLGELAINKNSALIIGQTEVDRSLIQDGKILSLLDFRGRLVEIKNNYEAIYYKPHPYAKENADLNDVLKSLNVIIIRDNIYQIICNDNLKSIYAISSSVIEEAKYFGIKSEYLKKEVNIEYVPIFNNYFDTNFWCEILGSFTKVNKEALIKIPSEKNRLRNSLGMYWGYDIFEHTVPINPQKSRIKKYLKSLLFH